MKQLMEPFLRQFSHAYPYHIWQVNGIKNGVFMPRNYDLPTNFRRVNIVHKHLRKYFGWAFKARHEIWIDPRLPDREVMYSIIHETGHLADWRADETEMESQSAMQTEALWREGFRRCTCRFPEDD